MATPTFIPNNSLRKLVCAKCSEYLSVFPVYIAIDGSGSICGRCVNPKNVIGIKNDVYESAVQFMHFPCHNDKYGCLDCANPFEMSFHEEICRFRKASCPTESTTGCSWSGGSDEYLEHFENNHPTLLLKEPSFEIDFVHDYSDTSLMLYAENLFLIRRCGNTAAKMLWFSISNVDDHENNSFNYILTLHNGNKTHDYTLPKRKVTSLEDTCEISAADVQEQLDDPTTIIASVDILQDEDVVITSSKDLLEESNPNINYDMLKILECPVCFEYMIPPIYQCAGGHSICGGCKSQVNQCPTCQKSFGDTQNFAVESFTSLLNYPCKNSHQSCPFFSKACEIKQHESLCKFGLYDCPIKDYTPNQCSHKCMRTDIISHCKNIHKDNMLELDVVCVSISDNVTDRDEDCFVMQYFNDIFILHFLYEDRQLFWSLQLIGPPEECDCFCFDVDIIDNTGKNLRIYLRGQCESLTTKSLAFQDEKSYLSLTLDQVSPLINEHLTYKIRVLRN